LIRWNLLTTKLDEAKADLYELRERTGAYADVPEKLYYEYADDGESLVIYGLNRGDDEDKSGEFDFNTIYVSPANLNDAKIESIYSLDPNTRQFWPIWQVFLDGSNGQLVNDYGY
jgi:hypothetical protein